MSFDIFDNFLEIFDSEDINGDKYVSKSNCFDLQNTLDLTFSVISSTPIRLASALKTMYDYNFSNVDELSNLLNDIDSFLHGGGVLDSLNDIIFCYIFKSANIDDLLGEVLIDMRDNNSGLDQIFVMIDNYKQKIDSIVPLDELQNFELEDIDNLDILLNSLEEEKVLLDEQFKVFKDYFLEYFKVRFDISDENYANIITGLENFSLEDFDSREDFKYTISASLKSLFIMDNNKSQIIGESDFLKSMEINSYINMFVNTYSSVFEYLITDFTLDFSNIEGMIRGYNPEDLQNLRFMYYVQDSFKNDVIYLKRRIMTEMLFRDLYRKNTITNDYVLKHNYEPLLKVTASKNLGVTTELYVDFYKTYYYEHILNYFFNYETYPTFKNNRIKTEDEILTLIKGEYTFLNSIYNFDLIEFKSFLLSLGTPLNPITTGFFGVYDADMAQVQKTENPINYLSFNTFCLRNFNIGNYEDVYYEKITEITKDSFGNDVLHETETNFTPSTSVIPNMLSIVNPFKPYGQIPTYPPSEVVEDSFKNRGFFYDSLEHQNTNKILYDFIVSKMLVEELSNTILVNDNSLIEIADNFIGGLLDDLSDVVNEIF